MSKLQTFIIAIVIVGVCGFFSVVLVNQVRKDELKEQEQMDDNEASGSMDSVPQNAFQIVTVEPSQISSTRRRIFFDGNSLLPSSITLRKGESFQFENASAQDIELEVIMPDKTVIVSIRAYESLPYSISSEGTYSIRLKNNNAIQSKMFVQ